MKGFVKPENYVCLYCRCHNICYKYLQMIYEWSDHYAFGTNDCISMYEIRKLVDSCTFE